MLNTFLLTLKLPKTKKLVGYNGMVKGEKTETEYLPFAACITWFRREHPLWTIITEVEQLADKAVVMKATIKDMLETVLATARKKEPEADFRDYIDEAETGSIGRGFAICGYGTLQAPEFDEQDRLADTPVERKTQTKPCEWRSRKYKVTKKDLCKKREVFLSDTHFCPETIC